MSDKVRELAEEIAMSNRESVPGCAPDKYERILRAGLKELRVEAQRELWRRLEEKGLLRHDEHCAKWWRLRPDLESCDCSCGLEAMRKELFG